MSGSTRKIIIASGDSTPQELLDLLWNEGYEPLCARTRSQTLDLLNARSDIHAVLMDIDLEEDFGGVHTAWEIQADSQGRSIPLFFYPRRIDADAIHAMRGVHHAGVVPRTARPSYSLPTWMRLLARALAAPWPPTRMGRSSGASARNGFLTSPRQSSWPCSRMEQSRC